MSRQRTSSLFFALLTAGSFAFAGPKKPVKPAIFDQPPSAWDAMPMESGCEFRLDSENAISQFRFGPFADVAKMPGSETGKGWVKNALIYTFAVEIVKHRRFPSVKELNKALTRFLPKEKGSSDEDEDEDPRAPQAATLAAKLLKNPDLIVGPKGVFKDHIDIVAKATLAYPQIFARVRGLIQRQAFLFFRHRLRPPTFEELGGYLKFEDLRVLQAHVYQPKFWSEGLLGDLGNHIDFAKTRVVTAFARAVRGTDTDSDFKTRRIRPLLRRLVQIMIITKSNLQYRWRAFTGDHQEFNLVGKDGKLNQTAYDALIDRLVNQLEMMLGIAKQEPTDATLDKQWVFNMPVLYPGGIAELQHQADVEYMPTFRSFVDLEKFPDQYAEKVLATIVEAPRGVLVSAVKPGNNIDWDFFNAMVKESRDTGRPIILIPMEGSVRNLDPKLLEFPEVSILTRPIKNDYINFNNTPATSQDPFSKIIKQNRFQHKQQMILPHYKLKFMTLPTAENEFGPTQFYATGCINRPEQGYVGKFQQNKAEAEAAASKRSFLVVDKADKGTESADFGGVVGPWLIRPVEFREVEKGPSYFVDVDQAYSIPKGAKSPDDVTLSQEPPIHFMMFDLHSVVANPRVLKAFKDAIRRLVPPGRRFTIVIPDGLDNKSNNAHVEQKQNDVKAVNRLIKTGMIFGEDELNDLDSNINALQDAFPGVEIALQWDNHSQEWLYKNLLNKPTDLQKYVNGPLASEIQTAIAINGYQWTPLEYLLIHRKAYLSRSSLNGSESYLEGRTFIKDLSRIQVLKDGQNLKVVDDDGHDASMEKHGHQGAGGARSSFRTHVLSEARSSTGDAHRPGYEGSGDQMWTGVGAFDFKTDYTDNNGYSGWVPTFAVITAGNTFSMLQYESRSGSFLQRPELGIMPPDQFFINSPLTVVKDMNDDQGRQAVDLSTFTSWFQVKANWINEGTLQPPKLDVDDPPDKGIIDTNKDTGPSGP